MHARALVSGLILCATAIPAALAGEATPLSVGGGMRPVLGMTAADQRTAMGTMSHGLQLGSLPGFSGEEGRFAVTVLPNPAGGVQAGVTGSLGAPSDAAATRYGLHVGAVWAGDRFSLNPSRLGLTDSGIPDKNDLSMTITLNHPLTPNLSLIGTAEARRSLAGPDSQNAFSLGAGLGWRF